MNRLPIIAQANRQLLWMLIKREIVSRTSGTLFGGLWMVLQPGLQVVAMWFLVSVVLNVRYPGVEGGFVGYYLIGVIPWLLLSESILRSLSVLTDFAALYQRSIFPIAILPIVPLCVSGVVYLIIYLIVGAVLAGWSGLVGAAMVTIFMLLWLIPIVYLLAVLGLFFRDIQQAAPFVLTMFLYLTPVLYLPSAFPHHFAWWLTINPFAHLISLAHAVVQGVQFHPIDIWVTAGIWLSLIWPARKLFLRALPHMREAL